MSTLLYPPQGGGASPGGPFVPYSGATQTVDLNQQILTNVSGVEIISGPGQLLLELSGTTGIVESVADLFITSGSGGITLQPSNSVLNVTSSAVQLTQILTPSTPPDSGTCFLYFKSDEKLYRMNPAGVETLIG